jgi:hypothetical protein
MTPIRSTITWLATAVGTVMALVGVWGTRWGDWNAVDASKLVATGIAIVAGTVVYRLAMDDPQARADAMGHGDLVHHH